MFLLKLLYPEVLIMKAPTFWPWKQVLTVPKGPSYVEADFKVYCHTILTKRP